MKKILFVCTGNSCRSVMAEGLLKKMLQGKGRTDVQVSSAGTNTADGIRPTLETIETMRRVGVDVSGHCGRQVTEEMVKEADLVLCMENFHREQILSALPEVESKVRLLKGFGNAGRMDEEIPDPIGRPIEMYARCLDDIQGGVEQLFQWLEQT